MSIFDHQRLTDATFKLDVERMRMGWYTDKYFTNIAQMLSILAEQGYTYSGKAPHLPARSSRAASSISKGISSKYDTSSQIAKGREKVR